MGNHTKVEGQGRVEMIPYMQIRPNLILTYELPESPFRRTKLEKLAERKGTSTGEESPLQNLKGKAAYSGDMTESSIKRLRKVVNTLYAIAENKQAVNFKTGKYFTFKLNFITLTLPSPQGKVTDKELKKEVLDVWIKAAKRKFKLRSYVWKAERQKNGNLHFHLTTDTYIPFDQLRDSWNQRLERLGFISEFERKHGHRNPNSTDVHATYKVKNLAGYLVKYMTKKNGEGDIIEGKVWDCSENLKQKERCEFVIDSEIAEWLEAVRRLYPEQIKKMDNCTLCWLRENEFQEVLIGVFRIEYNKYLDRIRNFVRTPRLKKKVDRQPVKREIKKERFEQLELRLIKNYGIRNSPWVPAASVVQKRNC